MLGLLQYSDPIDWMLLLWLLSYTYGQLISRLGPL